MAARPAAILGMAGALLLCPARPAPADQLLDRVAASVAGEPILLSELVAAASPRFSAQKLSLPGAGQALDPVGQRVLLQLLEQLIQERLIAAEAHRLQIVVLDEELDRAAESVAAANGIGLDQLYESLPGQGFDRASFRSELGRQMLRARLLQLKTRAVAWPAADQDPQAFQRQVQEQERAWLAELEQTSGVVRFLAEPPPKTTRPDPPAGRDLPPACSGTPQPPLVTWLPDRLPAPPPPGPLARIDFAGHWRVRPADLAALLRSRIGAACDPVLVARDLRGLWALLEFDDLRVETSNAGGSSVLTFRVAERALIGEVWIAPVVGQRQAELQGSLGLVPGRTADSGIARAGERRWLDGQHTAGHLEAVLEVRYFQSAPDRLDVCVLPRPGPAYQIGPVAFTGNTELDAATLTACLGERPEQIVWPEPELALVRLNACYFDRGMIGVRIPAPRVQVLAAERRVEIVFSIEEGPVFRIGRIDFEGTLLAPVSLYRDRLGMRSGEVFSRARLIAGLERLRKLHQAYGRDNLTVEPATRIEVDTRSVHLTLQVAVLEP